MVGAAPTPEEMELSPLEQGASTWNRLLEGTEQATLYHRPAWLKLLQRAYDLQIFVAAIGQGERCAAGCLLARSRNPFRRGLIGLPFSDSCPPLAQSPQASAALVGALPGAVADGQTIELRGVAPSPPWQIVDCFNLWSLDLDRPLPQLEAATATNFRRNRRQAVKSGITLDGGRGIEHVIRFHRLMAETRRRQGVPAQPLRFFRFAHGIFGSAGQLEVRFATLKGRDLAGLVLLREGDDLYYKWAARREDERAGAGHLLLWSVVEEFATRARRLDLGRADSRNLGLSRFKRELGASSVALPYAFFPKAPRNISPEVLTGSRKALAMVWRRMPLVATRAIGGALYRFLT